MAKFLFIFYVALCIAVTLMTSPPDYQRIRGLAFGTLTAEQKAEAHGSITKMDIVFSVILIAIVIGILSYFTG
jgi:SSS family solute:Na+ symporter